MKIMHLADLHLGRSILEQSLINDQKYIIGKIIEIIIKENIEMIMICGDVYDKSIPSIEAVNLFSSFLGQLYNIGTKVLIIAGNHDSKDRLSFGSELFSYNNIYIEGTFNGKIRKEVFKDSKGNINVYMLPFIKPLEVKRFFPDSNIDSYNSAVKTVIDNTIIDKKERNIIMLHQFVTGSFIDVERSESETFSLGGIENVDVNIFKDFDYVAMGHIHGPQKLIKDTIRYAGSPLKYSFSESSQNKSIPIIDFVSKNNINIKLVNLFGMRDMRVIKGPLDKLLDKEIYSKCNRDDYIDAIITDNNYIVESLSKLRSVYPNILKLEYSNARTSSNKNISDDEDISHKSPLELFEDFYFLQNNLELDDDGKKIISDIVKEVLDEAN